MDEQACCCPAHALNNAAAMAVIRYSVNYHDKTEYIYFDKKDNFAEEQTKRKELSQKSRNNYKKQTNFSGK